MSKVITSVFTWKAQQCLLTVVAFISVALSTGKSNACDVVVGGPVGVVPASFGVQQFGVQQSFGGFGVQSACGQGIGVQSFGVQSFGVPTAQIVSLQSNPVFLQNQFSSFSSFNSFNGFGAVAVAQPVVVVRRRGLVGNILGNVFAPRVRVRVRGRGW